MSTDLAFTPVPVRPRRDGWTPLRQTMFVLALADTRCVTAAARAAGMSWQTAYRLRARPDAASFAAAWDRAVAGPALDPDFTGRALGGTATPITYRGKRIGERRRFDNRLAMYLLSIRRPERYDGAHRPDPVQSDPYDTLAHTFATLDADRLADTAPGERDASRADVASTSSPFAAAASPGIGRTASKRRRDARLRHAARRTGVDGGRVPP